MSFPLRALKAPEILNEDEATEASAHAFGPPPPGYNEMAFAPPDEALHRAWVVAAPPPPTYAAATQPHFSPPSNQAGPRTYVAAQPQPGYDNDPGGESGSDASDSETNCLGKEDSNYLYKQSHLMRTSFV